MAEFVEATGWCVRRGGCDARWLSLSKPPGVGVRRGGCDARWLSLSKPPGPLRLPVPSTGSGTSVTVVPGPFDRLRDLCHRGSRSLRQAQGPLSPWFPVPSTGSGTSVTTGPGPFDRLRDLCYHGSRSLRQAQGPLSPWFPVPSTGSGTSVATGPGPFDRLRDLCHCGSRALRQAQGPCHRQAQGPLPHGIRPSTMDAGAALPPWVSAQCSETSPPRLIGWSDGYDEKSTHRRHRRCGGIARGMHRGGAGCRDSAPVEMTALPSASPTSTADADIERDKAALPIPAEGISDWANTAVPAPEPGEGAGTLSGWMSQSTSPNMLTSFTSLPPGDYQAQIACRGEGTITVTAGEIDAALPPQGLSSATTRPSRSACRPRRRVSRSRCRWRERRRSTRCRWCPSAEPVATRGG